MGYFEGDIFGIEVRRLRIALKSGLLIGVKISCPPMRWLKIFHNSSD